MDIDIHPACLDMNRSDLPHVLRVSFSPLRFSTCLFHPHYAIIATEQIQHGEGDAVKEIRVSTKSRTELVDITREVQKEVAESGVHDGICHIYVPHTTAGVTINENADPSVREDILMELNKTIPFEDSYRHLEGNAAAHVKATIVGSSETVPVEGGRLALGTWQGVFFCEFDGPRSRRVLTKVV
jgi:secondary thiamine-phosphate synthase enzyme